MELNNGPLRAYNPIYSILLRPKTDKSLTKVQSKKRTYIHVYCFSSRKLGKSFTHAQNKIESLSTMPDDSEYRRLLKYPIIFTDDYSHQYLNINVVGRRGERYSQYSVSICYDFKKKFQNLPLRCSSIMYLRTGKHQASEVPSHHLQSLSPYNWCQLVHYLTSVVH